MAITPTSTPTPSQAPDYETHDYDVVVIGAGGAGLRAAIEAKQRGLRTALVCKSLLGKAHTVMAEGGMAAAMGNVWPEDNWKVHFRDTMPRRQDAEQLAHGPDPRPGGPRPRRTSWSVGARCSTAPRTGASSSATSAATATPAWPTWATAPAWS